MSRAMSVCSLGIGLALALACTREPDPERAAALALPPALPCDDFDAMGLSRRLFGEIEGTDRLAAAGLGGGR